VVFVQFSSHFQGNVIWFVVLVFFLKTLLILGKRVIETWILQFKHHLKLLQKFQE